MKRVLLSILLILILSVTLLGQDKMIVDKPCGVIYYGEFAKGVNSTNQLPPLIIDKIENIIKTKLGDFNKDVHFEYGQIIDLKRYFDVNKNYNIGGIIPRYELCFILKDQAVGIKSYPLEINLDDFGQVLKFTWPLNDTTESSFLSRDTVKAFVLRNAAQLNFNQTNYEVDFRYDQSKKKLFWIFRFAVKNDDFNDFDCMEVNWSDMEDFKTYRIRRVVVN